MDAPYRQRNPFLIQRRFPCQHVLVDAIDESAVQVEEKSRLGACHTEDYALPPRLGPPAAPMPSRVNGRRRLSCASRDPVRRGFGKMREGIREGAAMKYILMASLTIALSLGAGTVRAEKLRIISWADYVP